MATLPRNLRTKAPRPVRPGQRGATMDRVQSYHYLSPTPPPVTTTVAPRCPVADSSAEPVLAEEAALQLLPLDEESRSSPLRIVLLLVAVACGLSAWGYRQYRAKVAEAAAAAVAAASKTVSKDAKKAWGAALARSNPGRAAATAKPKKKSNGWTIRHEGYVAIDGGILLAPKSFSTGDGSYDLLLHFHGDVAMVRESVEAAGVNAIVAIVNWGVGSAIYKRKYEQEGQFERLLVQINKAVRRRGVKKPKLRRLALSAWSAGYGAIKSILEHRKAPHADRDPLDAVIVLDGIHCGFRSDGRLNEASLLPMVRLARAAVEEQLMFLATHSQIETHGYASTTQTAEVLLRAIAKKAERPPMLELPKRVQLRSAAHAISRQTKLVPLSDTRVGALRIRGFKGKGKEHHAVHLTQMAPMALTDLRMRWTKMPPTE
jgi:hypothetical protein